jgi:meso-butanediol dehydrogenase/(S,S)-butanediol dehydrogenase/diacetyl reductase
MQSIQTGSRFHHGGDVALVTGGAFGIGRATCERLAAEGISVGVADIDADGATKVAESIKSEGGSALPIAMDVTDAHSVHEGMEAFVSAFGHINYLVANAGIFIYKDFETFPIDDYRKVLGVNVDGQLFCCQEAARRMLGQGEKFGPRSIVFTTSEGSFSQDPPSGVYITSKWASRGLMRSVSEELFPQGINVNGVGPGSVYTDLHKYVNKRYAEMNDVPLEEATELFAKIRPIQGYQPAEEIAACISYLLSDEARHMSGITLLDNGGHVMA